MSILNNKFIGGRIIKTGISVLMTATICHLLNWPAMFAVITAIVTIEPTAADSIRKAYIRFPASAIGAAFAVLFTFLFGDSPISYTLVALFTIIACQKLNFHDGMLVATLTGVAMISTVHDSYLSSFLIRLGTTSTGLIVSSLVNIMLLPPNYLKPIRTKLKSSYLRAGEILFNRAMELFDLQTDSKEIRLEFQSLTKETDKLDTLFTYQKEEWKFHKFKRKDAREHHYEYKKFLILRQVVYHIGNLIYLPNHHFKLDQNKRELILCTVKSLKTFLCGGNFTIHKEHHEELRKITEWFSLQKEMMNLKETDQHFHIRPETIIIFELLSIYDLIEELYIIQCQETRHDHSMKNGSSSTVH